MDTSETYIKMCEKAEEIQKEHKPNCGDYFKLAKPDNRIVIMVEHPAKSIVKPNWLVRIAFPWATGDNLDYKYIKDAIWLPRQDQLQAMVKSSYDFACDDFELVELFYNFCWGDDHDGDKEDILSMEQFWLVFVMKEKYNKTWDGNDWMA